MSLKSKLSKAKRRLTQHTAFFRSVITFSLLGIFLFAAYTVLPPALSSLSNLVKSSSNIISFTQNPAKTLASTSDRTNLLLLGMGGAGHEGSLLTDSIVLISFHHPSKTITLISVPRDIWVESMKAKINTAYYYGDQKTPGNGLLLAKSATSEITGLPIHYGFAINFDGFKEVIDLLGGIDVQVERTFDDYKYPIPGRENAYPIESRYEDLHFQAGLEHMDGERALKFVRSRQAEGEEGTDFARSQRQQKVIAAIQASILSTQTLLQPKKLIELASFYQDFIDTDIASVEYGSFAKMALTFDTENIKSIPLTTGDQEKGQLGILQNPKNTTPYLGQYVLVAQDNNWAALKQYIQNQLE